jgi:hypothetical protein
MSVDNIISIPHTIGVYFLNIFSISAVVRNDAGTLLQISDGLGYMSAGMIYQTTDLTIYTIDNSNIYLRTEIPGTFSSGLYSDPFVNRGQITLWVNT